MREAHEQQGGIHVQPERCSRIRFAGSLCRRCIDACPIQAIRIGDDLLQIDHSCIACRFCIPACPNEVFSQDPPSLGAEDGPNLLYCSALLEKKDKALLAKTPHFITPCVGSIPAHRILEQPLCSKPPLEVITGPCDSCSLAAGERSFRNGENEVRALLELLRVESMPFSMRPAAESDRADLLQKVGRHKKELEEKSAMSRRDLFLRFRERVLSQDVSGQDSVCVPPDQRGPNQYMRRVIAIVHARLTDEIRLRKIPFLRDIVVGEDCTGCGVCAALCPTGALSMGGERGRPELLWKPAHCSRCDLCLEACPRKAIRFLPGVEPEKIARETATAVRRFYSHICPECGDTFLSLGPEARCPGCSKREKAVEDLCRMIYK
jgi:ferredoxin